MINSRTAIGIIPARGGSKGLPGKNIRPMCGKPLIAWTIEKALQSRHLDVVMVSTDSLEIAAIAREHGAEVPFLRPADLATDTANSYDVIRHALGYYRQSVGRDFVYTALLEPTSPLREDDDIDRVLAALDARGFRPEDFARSHPGGALGRRLLTLVSDVMRTGDQVPRVSPQTAFGELMREMSFKGLGASAVVDEAGHPLGIFTDGDLRRLIEKGQDLRGLSAGEVMHAQPRTIRADVLAVEAAEMMEQHRITSLLVVDAEGLLCGALNTNDLMRAKVI